MALAIFRMRWSYLMKQIQIDIKHIHLILTRYRTGELVSVTLAPSGYVIDAHCDCTGLSVELTDDEVRYILYSIGIDPD